MGLGTPSPQSTDSCCRHVTLVTQIITGSYMTTTRKPQFSEEDPWSQVESSKFRPMFTGVNVSFHLYEDNPEQAKLERPLE